MSTALDHYKLLGRSGLRVSPLALGAMTFGTDWGWGTDQEESRKIFEAYAERGGNFIDTANYYTNGTSEIFLAEFMKGRREDFVVATKYTLNTHGTNPNAGGNHRRNMMRSVEASLDRLATDYIDLYWVHAWEFRTPIEEVMRGLDDLVRQGKILYVGVSDTPAWKIAEANTLARLQGWTPFVATQVHYNLIERTVEADLVPMAREHGVAVQPWSPLAGGVLSGKYGREHLKARDGDEEAGDRRVVVRSLGQLTERNLAIVDVVKQVAEEIDRTPSQVSLNWLLGKPGVVSPIVGARKLSHLEDNLGALDFDLTPEQMDRLDEASAFELPFPWNFMASEMYHVAVDGEARIEGGLADMPRENSPG
jgi:aryl-alcohol dehydrogenase-like predicted oxidoreductase